MARNVFPAIQSAGGGFLEAYQEINFLTSNTSGIYLYTPPSGTKTLMIYLAGGGGGGGGGTDEFNAGGGGAAGGVGLKLVTSGIAGTYYISLGYGGAGGNKGSNGSAGQNSEIYIGENSSGTLLMRIPAGAGGGRADGGSDPYRGTSAADLNNNDWYGGDLHIPGGDGGPSGGGYGADNAYSGGHGGGNWFGGHGGPCAARCSGDSKTGHRVENAGCGGGGGQQMQGNAGNDSLGGRGTGGGVLIYAYA